MQACARPAPCFASHSESWAKPAGGVREDFVAELAAFADEAGVELQLRDVESERW